MKHLFLLLLLLTGGASGFATQLTFRVDMSQQTVAAGGVHVAGNFQAAAGYAGDWNPATTELLDPDNDRIFELTVNVPAGTYLYKFVNGTTWPSAELVPADCGLADGGGNVNRQIILGATDRRLPAVSFGGCLPQVVFSVNMRGRTVPRSGVHVVGNFQALAGYGANWDPTSILLTDNNGDGIYDARVTLPANGRFQYKYVNGNVLTAAETVPAACGFNDGTGNVTRILDATAALTTVPTVCFATCDACGPSPTAYATHWWNDAVFYEVFVRSFYDTNADGQGDFAGLTAKLDYLNDGNPATTTDLGVTALWLMPMMESPSYHGYDVTNYKATEPDYGSMADFETFRAAAHARGIKVIIDLVLNHTSSQHPWFQQSASGASSSFRDWYRWSPTSPGAGWYLRNGSYYYGYFWSEMPDLNWRNPQMKAAMWDATRFWLKKGIDGYRLDAVKFLVETGQAIENTPETLGVLEEFHDSVRAVNPNAFTVGEAWTNTAAVASYVVNDRLDACFEFDLATAITSSVVSGNATALRTQLALVDNTYPKLQYGTFLTNHDQNRVMSVLGGNMPRMKQAAALYLTMPGVPFLYYGEEIGMLGTGVDEEKRKPMQWNDSFYAGFSTVRPWRTVNSNFAQYNVATMQADPTSLLAHYKKLISLRLAQPVLRRGYLLPVTAPTTSLLSYARVYEQEGVVVVANLGSSAASSAAVSLAVSSLPAGSYQVTDLYSGQPAGQVTLNAQGGFSNWTPTLGTLDANQTWVLHLKPAQPTAAAAAQALALNLYPNPATTQVRLELTKALPTAAQIKVYDLTGRLLHSAAMPGRTLTLNTSAWANGTYFVQVQAGKSTSVHRLVVAH
ncbi:alpha-amylase family glycosyl hydrolase [Hymenobacter persicinus]|nr:alpha-amylase family glycosyl hydrolase [Hymenobacter persicinus]